MSQPRSDWPATDFHPEFGFLCPSPRRRRSIRRAVVCIMAGMAIGATVQLAVAHWRDSDVGLTAPAIGPIDDQFPSETPAPSFPEVAAIPSTPAADDARSGGMHVPGSCKDLSSLISRSDVPFGINLIRNTPCGTLTAWRPSSSASRPRRRLYRR